MDTRTAVQRGIRRGLEIVANPDPQRLRDLREQASNRDLMAESWEQVGTALSDAMRATSR